MIIVCTLHTNDSEFDELNFYKNIRIEEYVWHLFAVRGPQCLTSLVNLPRGHGNVTIGRGGAIVSVAIRYYHYRI